MKDQRFKITKFSQHVPGLRSDRQFEARGLKRLVKKSEKIITKKRFK
jgi:hypothetical protein